MLENVEKPSKNHKFDTWQLHSGQAVYAKCAHKATIR